MDANTLHHDAIIIDATCPLLMEDDSHLGLYQAGGLTAVAPTIRANTGTSANALLQFAYWQRREKQRGDLVIVRKASDIRAAKKSKRIGVILHFQGTEVLDRSVDIIDAYHSLGLRVVQLTYNRRCHVGDGIEEPTDCGLSRYGRQVVRRLNETGIVVDCAHTGVRTTLDAIECSTQPVVISHSNARAIRDIPRNVPDEVIRAVAASGGVVGVTGFPNFVSVSARPRLHQFLDHIAHIAEVGGIDHVGLGIDYYLGQHPFASEPEARRAYEQRVALGVWASESYPEPPYFYPVEIATPDHFVSLTHGLLARGFSEEDVRKVLGLNWLRVYSTVWR